MKRILLSLLTFSIFSITIWAQDTISQQPSGKTLSLSLAQAKQYAIEHNRVMQNATYAEKVAEAKRWQAIASMLPQITLAANYNNFLGHEMDMSAMGAGKIKHNPNGTLTAQASITLSGTQIVGAQLAKMSGELSEISTKKNNQDITCNVMQTYMSILMLEKTDTLLHGNLKNIETLYESTKEAVRVGVSEETDADQLKVQVVSMQNTINQTERSINMLYNSLKIQLGATVDSEIKLTETIEDLLSPERAMALLSQDFSLEKNYDYQMLKAQNEIYKKQVTSAWWNYGPSITAFYRYSKYKEFSDKVNPFSEMSNIPHTVGVSANWTIFTSGSNAAKVKEAKLNYAQNKNTLETTEDQMYIQNKQLRYNLNSAYENYKNQEENLEVTNRVLESTANKFHYGTASAIDLTTASNNMIAAQNNYVAAMTDLVNAQIELEKLLNMDASSTRNLN